MAQVAALRVSLSEIPVGSNAPNEFRLFRFGANPTRQGTFYLDQDGANLVIARWKEHGVDLAIDYEHQAVSPVPVEAPAAGWFDLEIRPDGLWATNVRWTNKAAERIKAAEYRYFSPVFETKQVEGKRFIVGLVNAALTNLPATDNQQALIAAKAIPFKSFPILDGVEWDERSVRNRLYTWAMRKGGNVEWNLSQAFTWQKEAHKHVTSFMLPHHDVVDGELVTCRDGVLAAAAVVSSSSSRAEIPEALLADIKAHLAAHYQEMGLGDPPWMEEELRMYENDEDECEEEMTMESKTLNAALGLKAEAKEAETLGEVMALRSLHSDIVSLTGAGNAKEAFGIVAAWKESHGHVAKLRDQVTTLSKEAEDAKRNALVEKAIAEGKLAPKDEKAKAFALSLGIEQLNAYIDTLQPSSPAVLKQHQVLNSASAMGDDAVNYAKRMGVSAEQLREYNQTAAKVRG